MKYTSVDAEKNLKGLQRLQPRGIIKVM